MLCDLNYSFLKKYYIILMIALLKTFRNYDLQLYTPVHYKPLFSPRGKGDIVQESVNKWLCITVNPRIFASHIFRTLETSNMIIFLIAVHKLCTCMRDFRNNNNCHICCGSILFLV